MPKRSSKPKAKDVNETAFAVVAGATGQVDAPEVTQDDISRVMAAMGKRGGLKGGPARARALSAARRTAIARRAAAARWSKKGPR
jgi:hypothetical protein